LVEVYDVDSPSATSQLANISTRAFVGTGDDVLIGGIIIGPPQTDLSEAAVVVRALGPSLGDATPPVAGALADPILELRNVDGDLVDMNDNWQDPPANQAVIQATGLAPTRPEESALLSNLLPGNYTAVVQGVGGTTGVGLVEFYHIGPTPSAR
jgi:hypothetical protein